VRAAFLILSATLLMVPWPLASVPAGFSAAAMLMICLAGLCYLWGGASAGRDHAATMPAYLWHLPAALFAAALVWAALQALPLWPAGVYHPLWSEAALVTGDPMPVRAAISASPGLTVEAALRLFTYGLTAWLAAQIGRDRHSATVLLRLIIWTAAATAAVGFVLFAFGNPDIFMAERTNNATRLNGPFLIPNIFAFYLGMGLISAVILLQKQLIRASSKGSTAKVKLSFLLRALFTRQAPLVIAITILLPGLFLTASRAGVACSLLGLLTSVLAYSIKQRLNWRPLAFIILISIAGGASIFGGSTDILAQRSKSLDGAFAARDVIYAAEWRLYDTAPMLGTGYGAYTDIADLTREAALDWHLRYSYGHSAWLETLAGLGLPASLILWSALGLVAYRILRGLTDRQRDSHFAAIAAGCMLTCALHSFVDGPTQTPATAITFAVIVGLGFGQSVSSRTLS